MVFCEYVFVFAFFSLFGWVYESIFYTLLAQKLVNSGFLRGPYCPIYGAGAIAVFLPLGSLENPFVIFFLSVLIAGCVEYFTGWLMEKLFHARWWDYSDMPFNIHGRVFLLGLFVFGVMAVLGVLWAKPLLYAFMGKLPAQALYMFTGAYCMMLLIDCVSTVMRLHKPKRRLFDRANDRYQAALAACKPLRMARVVMEKVIWGKRPVKDHSGLTLMRGTAPAIDRRTDEKQTNEE